MRTNVREIFRRPLRFYIRHPTEIIRRYFRMGKCAWQRATRGWSDVDMYNMGEFLLAIIPPMLDSLADNGVGYPQDGRFSCQEEWQQTLRGMANDIRDTSGYHTVEAMRKLAGLVYDLQG